MRGGFIRDLVRGIFIAVLSCGWLGWLIGLRILNWNPDLWNSISNPIGLLFHTSLLYAILGLIIGVFFTLAIKIVSLISGRSGSNYFIARWLRWYSAVTILLFAYLTITRTRPAAHVVIFDIPLVIAYCLSLLLSFYFISKKVRVKNCGLISASWIWVIALPIIGLAVSYIGTPKAVQPPLGNPLEIEAAVSIPAADTRVFLFGVDGAEWSIIDSLIANGKMPNTAHLIENGVRADFQSLPTLKSPLIWASMATGKVPEKHGILDFGSFQFPWMKNSFIHYPDGIGFYRLVYTIMPQADMPVSSTTRKVEAVWDILSMADITVGVAGWWASWPADKVNGWMISDRFTFTLFNPRANANLLKEGQTYPPELADELTQFIKSPEDMTQSEIERFVNSGEGIYPQEWFQTDHKEWNPLYQLKLGYTSGESFLNASLHLLNMEQPEFLTIYLEGNDMVSHFFWQYMDKSQYPDSLSEADIRKYTQVIPRYYCYWDSLLGTAMKHLAPGTDIIIVSDHGFGPDPRPKVPFRGGEHQPMGVFLASGPHFKKGVKIETGSVLDLTPTLLYLYNLPSGADMDGKVMTEAFTEEFNAQHEVKEITSYETGRRQGSSLTSSAADESMKQQLRALGYTK
ncbi:alkaline phosphatase family protein [bacterium]|nr:alkaline phosphatase family protein [bacterium]